MSNTDKRLTQAVNNLAEKVQQVNESVLSLNAVVNDYLSADQEREDRIRELEEEQRSMEEARYLEHTY